MNRISAIVITFNEEENITGCMESLNWVDEIIVVDSNSKDRTVELASRHTDKIFKVETLSYSQKRNVGIEKATGEWILWVDADERITENLRKEITEVIETKDPGALPCLIKRRSFFINKFIKHCGWYPDYTLRLFRKSAGIMFDNARVHERPIYGEKTRKLKHDILHYTDLTFEHYVNKLNSYTSASAKDLFEQRKKASIFDIVFRPVFTFIKMYLLKLGFADGYTGLVLCVLSSAHVLVKYAKLYFLNLKN